MRTLSILAASAFVLLVAVLPAAAAAPPAPYFNGFEDVNDTAPPAGTADHALNLATRVASGTNGVTSASGSYHAQALTGNQLTYTRYGGYSSTFPAGGYTTSVDIYLDTAVSDPGEDSRIDWSSAINNPTGNHRRDFVFSIGTNGTGGWVMSASNNTPGWPANPGRDPYTITTTGWYTFQHRFYDAGAGVLAVDMSVIDSNGVILKEWTLSDPTDIIGSTVGGNRYGWLVNNAIPNLALDNITRTSATIVPISGNTSAAENDPGWFFGRDPANTTPFDFNTNEASIGSGSLEVLPIGANGAAKFIGELFMLTPMGNVSAISYDFKIGAGGAPGDANHFYMSVYANFASSPATKFYDCRYSVVPGSGSTSAFTTVNFHPEASYPVATRGGADPSPQACPASPAAMGPDATLRVIALNVGDTSTSDVGLDGYLDNVVVALASGLTVYDFEPDTVAPSIAITTPADGGKYALDSLVTADYACSDSGGSGVATCTGTLPDGAAIDTSSTGTFDFTVNATDNKGNPASLTHSYAVVSGIASCKHGGWAEFDVPQFNNQGACVSYFVSNRLSRMRACLSAILAANPPAFGGLLPRVPRIPPPVCIPQ